MTVLDSSFFIETEGGDAPDDAVTVPGVRDELRDSAVFRFDALSGGGMDVDTPGDDAVDRVRRAARETGDEGVLSDTDVGLLALALKRDDSLLTDDYAVQNVASALGVETEGIDKETITEERDWRYWCTGCGRVYDESGRCRVCGSETTRKNPGPEDPG